MATPPGQWRALEQAEKFAYLANHFESADAFAEAAKLPPKTIRAIFTVLNRGQNSRVLEKPEVIQALQNARKRMTDQVRRTSQRAQKAQYVAPIARTKFGVIEPKNYQVDYGGASGPFTSAWISYRVEFLTDNEIFNLIGDLFNTFMDTGQYNAFRFEYVAESSVYLDESSPYVSGRRIKAYKDKALQKQHIEHGVIKLSTETFGFPDRETTFVDDMREHWANLKKKGAFRITDLYFTNFSHLQKVMPEVRQFWSDYVKGNKRVNKKNSRKGKPKGGAR